LHSSNQTIVYVVISWLLLELHNAFIDEQLAFLPTATQLHHSLDITQFLFNCMSTNCLVYLHMYRIGIAEKMKKV